MAGKSNGYQAKRCGICPVFVDTKSKFSDLESTRQYEIMSNLNCNSKNVVYLVQCKVFNIQYVGSASTKFRLRFNNYLSCSQRYSKGETVPQMTFHSHFLKPGHNGFTDCEFILIDQFDDIRSLQKKRDFLARETNII